MQSLRRRLCARLDFHGGSLGTTAAATPHTERVRDAHVTATHRSRRKGTQFNGRGGVARGASPPFQRDTAHRRSEQHTARSPSLARGATSAHPAAPSTASAFTSVDAARARAVSSHARAAFHSFLHSRNAPYVQPSTAAPSSSSSPSSRRIDNGLEGAAAARPLTSSAALTTAAAADAADTSSSAPPSLLKRSRDAASGPHAASSSSPRHAQAGTVEAAHTTASNIDEDGRRPSATPVLQEWSLEPSDAGDGRTGPVTTNSGRARTARHGAKSCDPHAQRAGRDDDDNDAPRAHRGPADSTHEAVHRAPPDSPHELHRQQHCRRRDALALASRELAAVVHSRHRHAYAKSTLHAYRTLCEVEQRLVRWAVMRQRRSHARRRRHRGSSRHGASGAETAGARVHGGGEQRTSVSTSASSTQAAGPHAASSDIDAVEARFFEYAGLIQRTLHQLTPRHFDAVHVDRLRSASTSSPLLLMALLWRVLHIQRLFYRIGRHAGLPRAAVDVYVRSSNCAYGMREVLRVLAAELATTSTTARATADAHVDGHGHACGSEGAARAAPSSLPFSNAELFQLFYAVLCIPSEEAPGVPLPCAPAAAAHARPLDSFQLDSAANGGDVGRMPLDEWCVRWWAHQYAIAAHGAELHEAADTEGAPPLPLPLAASLDVLRACLYTTRTTSSPSAPPAHRDGRQHAAVQNRLVTPLMFFETPPEGGVGGGARGHRVAGTVHRGAHAAAASAEESRSSGSVLRVLDRRFRPRLSGAVGGGDRASLRIPFHLGQRYVRSLLQYLLSRASRLAEMQATGPATRTRSSPSDSPSEPSVDVAAALQRLLDGGGGGGGTRDAVRDVALLCTAILFFEVYTPSTARFMAHAAPLCRAQVELLSGHEVSCVLLAYASLQRWQRRSSGSGSGDEGNAEGGVRHRPDTADARHHAHSTGSTAAEMTRDEGAASRGRGSPLRDSTIEVKSASTAATARAAAAASTSSSSSFGGSAAASRAEASSQARSTESQRTATHAERAAPHNSADAESASWHVFFVALGTRAGQLSDTLSEEDVTRVLRAMELTGLEHADLRRAMESSLRLRNLGRHVLYET